MQGNTQGKQWEINMEAEYREIVMGNEQAEKIGKEVREIEWKWIREKIGTYLWGKNKEIITENQ